MENYEEILRNNLPTRPEMTVPDGYFDSLYGRIMANIDKEESSKASLKVSKPFMGVVRSYVATVACVAIIVLGVSTLFFEHRDADAPQPNYETSTAMSTVDQAADYMMIDNDDIYAMLSE